MFTIQHSHWRRGHSPTPATHVHTHTRAARLNARHASLPPPPPTTSTPTHRRRRAASVHARRPRETVAAHTTVRLQYGTTDTLLINQHLFSTRTSLFIWTLCLHDPFYCLLNIWSFDPDREENVINMATPKKLLSTLYIYSRVAFFSTGTHQKCSWSWVSIQSRALACRLRAYVAVSLSRLLRRRARGSLSLRLPRGNSPLNCYSSHFWKRLGVCGTTDSKT